MILQKPVSDQCVITLRFGKYPLWLTELFGLTWHDGIDFAPLPQFANLRQRIFAAHPGMILTTGYNLSAGIFLTQQCKTESGIILIDYFHLAKRLVKQYQLVDYGTTIAEMGNTGHSTGKHLHFRVRVKKLGFWRAIDPANSFSHTPATFPLPTPAFPRLSTA